MVGHYSLPKESLTPLENSLDKNFKKCKLKGKVKYYKLIQIVAKKIMG